MKKILLVATLMYSVVVSAGGSEGLVEVPMVHVGDIFIFSAGSHQARPPCATIEKDSWAVSLSSNYGRAVQSLAMLAYAQGKRLHVQGVGSCNVWGDRETVKYAFIVD